MVAFPPISHPKMTQFLVGKPMVVGEPTILGPPIYLVLVCFSIGKSKCKRMNFIVPKWLSKMCLFFFAFFVTDCLHQQV